MSDDEICVEVEQLMRSYLREFPRGYTKKNGSDYARGFEMWARICRTASPLNDGGEYIRIVEQSLREEGFQT